ncbi:MerR family transcriptional regulator [Levilactobacillus parabrevis]|uniref:Transcriptional regulator n=1 Tax=Levilactobacillus parabrevis ATCC 53295 TaxID=1267003 RepID=A0A0R1GZG0_9LACO|nr:MerR family transcriptional regulator [Levilactobacillus parabrevis]KRK36769.1 transcriptional regulator [Levilactobacillus parabrevis ATCC 53295]KRO05986.1 transcriptional regulator [Levilactobacillus parabrevis]MCT4486836.1 MerR family transcriptional regulator [Levilactobacillus parabrevis]MCT4489241.1 MerR family transcriptional regulator [Levilactobacillus parabrevis]
MAEVQRHYRIGEFAKLVGLSTYTLRYYEDQGLVKSQRDENGVRYYTDEDIRWVGFILHLKGTGMRLNDLKRYVKLRAKGDATIPERRAMLQKTKDDAEADIAELQMHLQVLSRKIDWYDGKVDQTIADSESFHDYLQRFNDK